MYKLIKYNQKACLKPYIEMKRELRKKTIFFLKFTSYRNNNNSISNNNNNNNNNNI